MDGGNRTSKRSSSAVSQLFAEGVKASTAIPYVFPWVRRFSFSFLLMDCPDTSARFAGRARANPMASS